MSRSSPRAWTWRHAIINSENKIAPTTRHVLLTVSCHMNDLGHGCYPTIEMLSAETGLNERTVRGHLDKACSEGWLSRNLHGFKGQKWRNYEYSAQWPTSTEGAGPSSSAQEEGAESDDETCGSSFQKVRVQDPPSIPINFPRSIPNTLDTEFECLIELYPRKQNRKKAFAAFKTARKKGAVFADILSGLEAQLPELMKREQRFIPLLANWIKDERWTDEVAPISSAHHTSFDAIDTAADAVERTTL